jgi:hypothetical protein
MGGEMRQASWIAFLLLAVGLLTYDATMDRQEANPAGPHEVETLEGDMPPPKP